MILGGAAGARRDSRRAEWCYSKDRVLLSSPVELAGGTAKLEAIEVPNDSDAESEAGPHGSIAEPDA